jgi:rRNA methylase
LTNAEVELCTRLVSIPTVAEHTSLNLAQAVLILLYECVKADMALAFDARNESGGRAWTRPARSADSRRATIEEERLLLATLQETLQAVDHLPGGNASWFMQPMRRFLRKSRLRRHEFDMLMGICRQIRSKLWGNAD